MFNGHKIAGLCITKISDEGSFMLINELNEALLNVGYRLFIYQSNSDFYRGTQIEDGDKAIFKAIDYDAVDVVIIYERVFCDKNVVLDIIRDCNKYHKPIMVIGEKYEDIKNYLCLDPSKYDESKIPARGSGDPNFFCGYCRACYYMPRGKGYPPCGRNKRRSNFRKTYIRI